MPSEMSITASELYIRSPYAPSSVLLSISVPQMGWNVKVSDSIICGASCGGGLAVFEYKLQVCFQVSGTCK